MAIRYIKGDLFTSSAQVVVLPVNCKGVAGCGVALQAKQLYPVWFQAYQVYCRSGHLQVVRPVLFNGSSMPRWLLNFPTKSDWRHPSDLHYIERGLRATRVICAEYRVKSIAFPKLGCGAGELSWEQEVRPLMECYLSQMPCDVVIYV